jgi:hypothetical protein
MKKERSLTSMADEMFSYFKDGGIKSFPLADQIRLASESLDFSKKAMVLGPLLHLLISKPN